MGVRPCVTAKLPVLRPWFWNLILLNLAAASCYFIAFLVGGLRCNASRLLRMCWSSRGLPRLFLAPFNASSEKWKMPIEDKYFVLAPNQTVLLGFCAPSSVVSVASSWWVAAAGFVVVCCPAANVALGRVVGVAFGGALRVGSEISKFCDWKLLCRESGGTECLEKLLMFRDQQKSRQRFACFSSHGFLAVCDIHSVWAVLLVILNEVEVCPLFAALRVFCHAQHIRNMHATWRVAWPRNTPCCVHVAHVLRMTKPTQRCEGCKILKCLWTLSHFPLVDA